MKLRYIFATLAAALTLTIACQEEQISSLEGQGIKVSTKFVSLAETEGASATFTVYAIEDWHFDESSIPDWLSLSPLSGTAWWDTIVTAKVPENKAASRKAELKVIVGDKVQIINVVQAGGPVPPATVKEIMEGPDGSYFQVTGAVTAITGTGYGNWYLNDGTSDTDLYIYGTLDKQGQTYGDHNKSYEHINSGNANAWTLGIGDKVTISGPKSTYNGTVELVDVTIIKIVPSLLVAGKREFEVSKDGETVKTGFQVKGGSLGFSSEESWLHVSGITSDADSTYAQILVDPNADVVPREGKITFTSSDGTNTSEVAVTVKQGANAPDLMTIAEAAKVSYAHIKGTVMAICARGYVLADETGAILCYYGSAFQADQYKLGDVIEVINAVTAYNYGPQLSCDGKEGGFDLEEKISEGSGSVTYPTPKVIDQEALAALVASISGKDGKKLSDAIKMEYVQISVTPKKSGNYTNLFLDDYDAADFSAYQLPASFDLASMLDKKVTVRGYIQSISGGKHVNIVFTEMVEGEAEVPTIQYTDLSTLLPLAASADFSLTAIVAFVTSRNDAAIVTDGTNYFYLYKPATMPAVGDIVTASGKISVYNHLHESAQGPTVTVVESGANLPALTPNDITATFGSYFSVDPHPADYITAVGTYVVDGSYTNLVLDGVNIKGSLRNSSALKPELNGKKVRVTGWFTGSNSGGSFIYIDQTSIEEVS